jgi:polyhydroxyalkanoate synthase
MMAAAAAQRRPDLVERLVLLATPWDFFAGGEAASRRLASLVPAFESGFALTGTLPVDALQTLFSLADPQAVATRYRDFGRQDQTSARATRFVALEDWLNDGVPLAAAVARETLCGWYGANTAAEGRWRVAGAAIEPASLALPTLVALPARDRIVPPESARRLAEAIPGAEILLPNAGHVGMVAGTGAEQALWRPLANWLLAGGTA